MGRKVQHNNIVTKELLSQCNKENIELGNDFLDYLRSIDRAPSTIDAYANDLKIFWVYLLQHCGNKFFIDLSKRDISKYQSYCLTEYKWSPARMRRVKATLSSMSNYVENMLDDEFEDFRPIVKKIENPVNEKVFTKTVLKDEQLEKLLNILVEKKKYDQACMLALAMNSGRRKVNCQDLRYHILMMRILFMVHYIRLRNKSKQKAEEVAGRCLHYMYFLSHLSHILTYG